MGKTIWTLLFCAAAARAQPFGAGLKLGTTLTDAVSAVGSASLPTTQHLIVGPYVEVRLPLGLAVEADALYQPGLYNDVVNSGSTWQFPVLAKYKLLKGPVRPYIEGGPSFSRITDIKELPVLNHRSNFGIVLGAGVEVKLLVLRISPEIRYQGWALTNIQSALGSFRSNRNLATFTVGFGF